MPKVDKPVPVEAITTERLLRWKRRLIDAHATPIALFGVGHDHNSGKLVICTLDEPEMDAAVLAGYLRAALRQLEGG